MSVNSSSSNELLLNSHLLSTEFFYPSYLHCYNTGPSSYIYLSFTITNICLLLPLCIFILYHGHQQLQQKGSSSSAATMSHSDCFTYHVVTMELAAVLGCAVSCCGFYMMDVNMLTVGSLCIGFDWVGGIFFHVLTCLERYLAVVHPITYLNLKNERGIRIRNYAIGCIWLFCFIGLVLAVFKVFTYVEICLLVLSLTAVSFFSVSVLWVLIRPGPGEKSRGKDSIHQSKQKAFNTIVAILGVLVIKFIFNMIWQIVVLTNGKIACVLLTSCTWFNLPSSLVLPLLFLDRAGKFTCFKNIFK